MKAINIHEYMCFFIYYISAHNCYLLIMCNPCIFCNIYRQSNSLDNVTPYQSCSINTLQIPHTTEECAILMEYLLQTKSIQLTTADTGFWLSDKIFSVDRRVNRGQSFVQSMTGSDVNP